MKKLLFMRCSFLRIMTALLTVVVLVGAFSISVFATGIVASPTNSKITIDGVEVKFDAYNINGNNYFKLRDIAYSLTDTEKRFSVNWVAENNSANLITGEEYVPIGGEMNLGNGTRKNAVLSDTNIMVNGEKVTATAYLINGNNYFKLRDLGNILNFAVNWNEKTKTVEIDTDFEYITEEKIIGNELQMNYEFPAGKDSWVQQFLYKDEGMGYAYVTNDKQNLQIVLPNSKFTVKMLQPVLADVIADKDGNIYVVWGHINFTDNTQEETIFISKYNSAGELIISKGYTNPSQEMEILGAKEPFMSGNTVSAIGNNILIVHYSKRMYNGHQANGILSVNLSDLSPVDKWLKVFVSHSFGNDIIWSDKKQEFYFVNKGDAGPRGFILQTKTKFVRLLNFYLPETAGDNMSVVNETYAQLGGLVETKNGFAFCSASVKSLGPEALEEKQNLFIQFFDVGADGEAVYFGGEERTGMNSWYGKNETTVVTDKGIRWLTNYTQKSVVVPQVVKADDKIVILWSVRDYDSQFCKERYYMVLSENGEILVPETPLEYTLNSFEKPVYHNGIVSWIYYDYDNQHLGLAELKIN